MIYLAILFVVLIITIILTKEEIKLYYGGLTTSFLFFTIFSLVLLASAVIVAKNLPSDITKEISSKKIFALKDSNINDEMYYVYLVSDEEYNDGYNVEQIRVSDVFCIRETLGESQIITYKTEYKNPIYTKLFGTMSKDKIIIEIPKGEFLNKYNIDLK